MVEAREEVRYCFQNASTQDGLLSPCLRPLGHSGPHKHKELCNDMSCTCGGLYQRMSNEDFLILDGARRMISEGYQITRKIEKKYEVKPE